MSLPVATHKGPVNITHLGGREVNSAGFHMVTWFCHGEHRESQSSITEMKEGTVEI